MTSFLEARNMILANVPILGHERVSITDAGGRVLAEDVAATWDMPRWTHSAMDGYAVRSQDCAGPTRLRIAGFLPAGGAASEPLLPGTAVRIMTGAPLPPGADSVVPLEEAVEDQGAAAIGRAVKSGAHIRRKGEEIACGECVVPKGTLLRAADIGLLATYGKVLVPVFRRPRVAILSSGDELVELGDALSDDRLINSNSMALVAALKDIGADPLVLGVARDTRASHREKIREGLLADVLVTTAGVSAGDRDFVRSVLEELGARQVFWKVDIKPGRPMAFSMHHGRPVFSLPGNPISTLVTFEELVRPALLKMMGHTRVVKEAVEAILENDLPPKRMGEFRFQRVSLKFRDGVYLASCPRGRNAGARKALLRTDALALLPEDRETFQAGDRVMIHLLDPGIGMREG